MPSPSHPETPETVLAYLAGIVDADGTIICARDAARDSYSVVLSVHQAERDAVELFAEVFGGTVRTRSSTVTTREIHAWTTLSRNRVETLTRLLPYLRQKRLQAEIALEICALNASWRTPDRSSRRPQEISRRLRRAHARMRRANEFGQAAPDAPLPVPPKNLHTDLPPAVAAYLAGVLDADGHLRLRRQEIDGYVRYPVEVKLKQVTPDSIKVLQRYFGIKVRVEAPSIAGARRLLVWSCSARTAGDLLRAVEPYMRIKKERAGILLEALALKNAPRGPLPTPPALPGEPLLPLARAAELVGVTYGGAAASVRAGLVPHVRVRGAKPGEPRIYVPASFIHEWRTRDHRRRPPAATARLEELVVRCRALNSRAL